MPEMGLVTAFCPFTTSGEVMFAFQIAGETRFVVNCRVPMALVGHVKITLVPE
jgi:hypothetical protein